MLVLSRKTKQQIRIGNNITLTVLKVQGNTVRIGIEAPGDVRVVRAELPRLESQEKPVASEIRDTPADEESVDWDPPGPGHPDDWPAVGSLPLGRMARACRIARRRMNGTRPYRSLGKISV